ncbi:MAG TPA: FecR family protein, partial [Planctomycetota bacterium]|nr:FecR family protein [Planctomycetota bacterium]
EAPPREPDQPPPVFIPKPSPLTPPTARPAAAPATPEPPAPHPVEGPKTAPPETKPLRVALILANLEGPLEMQEGDAWKKVARSADWDAAGAVRTGERLARFTLPDGTRATLRPHSEVRLLAADPPSLSLERGEGFFEVIPGAGRRFSVTTPDARVDVTGTQFSVKRGDRTEILVSSGEVRVTNDKGDVSVPAGTGVSARRGSAPTKPRVVDTDRANSWRHELDGPETVRFRFDFEDGRLAPLWVKGKIVAGPARGLNHSCLEGNPGIDADLSRLEKRVATVHGMLKFRFRYWTAGAELLRVQFFSERAKDNFRFEVKTLGREKWEAVEIPVSELYRLADGTHPQEGDRFTWLNVSIDGALGPVYFDDIELVEVQK